MCEEGIIEMKKKGDEKMKNPTFEEIILVRLGDGIGTDDRDAAIQRYMKRTGAKLSDATIMIKRFETDLNPEDTKYYAKLLKEEIRHYKKHCPKTKYTILDSSKYIEELQQLWMRAESDWARKEMEKQNQRDIKESLARADALVRKYLKEGLETIWED
jgi:hypothetical protein